MANPKLYSEFRSDYGDFYLIEIWDEDYTGTEPDRFNVTGNGFELNYTGQTDKIYSPVIGSSVSLGMYIRDAATRAFAQDFKEYQENRYYIKIWKGQFSGQDADTWYNTSKVSSDGLVMWFTEYEEETVYLDFFWGGYILQDVVKIEDASEPYILQLSANDGIAKLKNVDGARFRTTFQNIFSNAIFNAYTYNIFPTEWPALKIASNWWSAQHTYSATEDPLASTAVDLDAFHTFDSDGNIRRTSYYDILTQVCNAFGMRFYFSNGSYRAEQIFQRDRDFIKEFSYKRDGNLIGYETVQRDKTIDQTSNKARLAGNIYNFLPAVNKVQIETDEGDVSYSGIVSSDVSSPTIDLGYTNDDPQNWLEISFSYEIELEINVDVNSNPIYYILDVDVNIDDGSTVYYLKRDHTAVAPNNASWTTTQSGSGFQVLVGPFYEEVQSPYSPPYSHFIRGTATVVTPTLPQDGDIEVEFNSNKFVTKTGSTRTLNASNAVHWNTTTIGITKMNGNNGHFVLAETVNADNDSGIIYDLGKSKVFDGNGNRGSLFYKNPSTNAYTLTTGWREGNSGTYVTAQRLIANEFLSLMNSPLQKYEGQIYSSHHFMTRLVFDSKNWLQLGGRFTAREDTWDGEWFAIAKQTIAIVNTDDGTVGDPVFSIGSSSLNGAVVLNSVETTDMQAVDVSTVNNVNVGNDLDVTRNADITGALDVTGDSRLRAGLTHDGFLIQEINDVTHSSGSTYNVQDTDYMIFNTWSGGTGTATVNLPRAADNEGRLLRFKSDGTISANTSINVVPQSGESVDGNGEFAFDRDYDGIMLLAHNDNWFIIQRKAK